MDQRDEFDLEKRVWWSYIDEDLQELLKEATLLVDKVLSWDKKFHDYSFIVFPAAKAYEGYLKTIFLEMGFITKDDYYGKRFRVGKALNPSLDRRYRRKESVYDKIVEYCGGKKLADKLWNTWKVGRNVLFHWFPDEKNAINYHEARERVLRIIDTMDEVYKECKINAQTK